MQCSGCRFRGRIGIDVGCVIVNRATGPTVWGGCKLTDVELDDIIKELTRERSRRMLYGNIAKGSVGNGKDSDRGR